MSKYNNYDDYDSYYDDEFSSKRKKYKPAKQKHKAKGHQSRFGKKAAHLWEDDNWLTPENTSDSSQFIPTLTQENNSKTPEKTTENFLSGDFTQIVGNYPIDFSRLADIQKIDQEYNGKMTYGIKFLFLGKKGLFRIIWFNRNKQERDKTYDEKFAYWCSILMNK